MITVVVWSFSSRFDDVVRRGAFVVVGSSASYGTDVRGDVKGLARRGYLSRVDTFEIVR